MDDDNASDAGSECSHTSSTSGVSVCMYAWVVQVVVKCLCGLFCSLDHSHNSVARAAFSVFKWHGGLDLRQFRNSVVPRQSPLIGIN